MEKFSSDLLNPVKGTKADHPARMLALHKSMPKLPVPALHQTLEKYLVALKPLLSEKEYAETEKVSKLVT
jgi:carnitine O-acetyltransferase